MTSEEREISVNELRRLLKIAKSFTYVLVMQ